MRYTSLIPLLAALVSAVPQEYSHCDQSSTTTVTTTSTSTVTVTVTSYPHYPTNVDSTGTIYPTGRYPMQTPYPIHAPYPMRNDTADSPFPSKHHPIQNINYGPTNPENITPQGSNPGSEDSPVDTMPGENPVRLESYGSGSTPQHSDYNSGTGNVPTGDPVSHNPNDTSTSGYGPGGPVSDEDLSPVYQSPVTPTGVIYKVAVGGPKGPLSYHPATVEAGKGDIIRFEFLAMNHTLTESKFEKPCIARTGGYDSGFQPNEAHTQPGPTRDYLVPDLKPHWFFSAQSGACGKGMVFALNPPTAQSSALCRYTAMVQNGTIPIGATYHDRRHGSYGNSPIPGYPTGTEGIYPTGTDISFPTGTAGPGW